MAKLGEICTFQSGGTPSKSNSEYFNGSIPWITTVALTGDYIDKNDAVDWITDKAIQESAAKIVPENSIMVGTRVGIGKVAINTVPMSTSQDIVSLINVDDTEWDKRFLCKVISARNPYLLSQARGATIKGIKIDTLAKLEIPKIPLNEQRRIAAVLDKVSDLIAKRREQLDKLDELVKARFVEIMQSVPLSKKLTIEEITERVKVGFVGTCEKYYTDTDGVPMLRTGNITDHGITLTDLKYVTREFHKKNKKSQSKSGDLLIARHGSNGQANVYNGPEAQCLNAVVIVPNQEIVKSEFLAALINSDVVKQQIEKTLVGSTQRVVNTKSIANLIVRIPSLPIQNSYEDFVLQTDKSKLTIQQSLDKLEVLKKALMQQYFG